MKQFLPIFFACALSVGVAAAAPVTVTLQGQVIGAAGGDSTASATLVFDPKTAPEVAACGALCPSSALASQLYDGAVQSLSIDLGGVSLVTQSDDAVVVNDAMVDGSTIDGVSFGAGGATMVLADVPIFGAFATTGLSFVDGTASALSHLSLAAVAPILDEFDLLHTEIYLINPFGLLQTIVIDWDEATLKVDAGDPVSMPLPMSGWLMAAPLLAWVIARRRWTARA